MSSFYSSSLLLSIMPSKSILHVTILKLLVWVCELFIFQNLTKYNYLTITVIKCIKIYIKAYNKLNKIMHSLCAHTFYHNRKEVFKTFHTCTRVNTLGVTMFSVYYLKNTDQFWHPFTIFVKIPQIMHGTVCD